MHKCRTDSAARGVACELPGAGSVYYGWVMLPLSMAALIASSPGQTFGVSIFNEPMRLSLELTHGELSAAYMLGTLLGAIPITYIGWQLDRHGARRTMLAVVSMFSAACLLTSAVQGWFTLVLAFCFLRMLGPGALSFLSGNTLAYWFERRLGAVEGVRQLGMAAAMGLIPIVNLWLVTVCGWRLAYAMLGAGIWIVLFPLFAWLFRNSPAEVGQHLDGMHPSTLGPNLAPRAHPLHGLTLAQSLRTPAFWIVSAGTMVFGLVHTAVFFCIVPILQDRGLDSHDAATTLIVFAVCLAIMQLVGGILADRMSAHWLLMLGLSGLSAGVLLLDVADSLALASLAGAVLGASQGLYFGATHPLWARYFGRRHMGRIRGVLMTATVATSSVGPFLAGLTRDLTGAFDAALLAFAVSPLPVAVLSLLARPPAPCEADGKTGFAMANACPTSQEDGSRLHAQS